jgi:hypothetical protein
MHATSLAMWIASEDDVSERNALNKDAVKIAFKDAKM